MERRAYRSTKTHTRIHTELLHSLFPRQSLCFFVCFSIYFTKGLDSLFSDVQNMSCQLVQVAVCLGGFVWGYEGIMDG